VLLFGHTTSSKDFALICIYHPPQGGATTEFFTDMTNFITFLKQKFKYIIVTGDLNVHLDTTTELPAMHAFEVFLANDMHHYGHHSTDRQGHLLDVVLTNEYCSIARLSIHHQNVSDHALITFSCRLKTNPRKKKACSGVCPSISHTPLLYVTDLTILKRKAHLIAPSFSLHGW